MAARLDNRLLYVMRTRLHTPGLERAMKLLGRSCNNGAIWFAIGVAIGIFDRDNRHAWFVAGLLGPIAIAVNYAIKLAVNRPRPVLEGLPPLGGAPSSLSFPSAHSTASFACATAMTRIAPEAGLLFILAGLIAVGRPYLGMHYPSDVLAGALLGTAIGLFFPLGALS